MSDALSFLSPALLNALDAVASRLEEGLCAGEVLDEAIDRLNELPPGLVGRADGAIADAARLWDRTSPPKIMLRILGRFTEKEQLIRLPGLEFVFLFHRNGRIREAALQKIADPLPSPFLFAMIAWRLNDWAAPVREAAVRCAARNFPVTDPEVVARAATALLVRQGSWGRWETERAVLDAAFAREDVLRCLADLLSTSTTGPLATTLRHALRTSGLDVHLERIARTAVQPAVRSVALEALIDRRTSWRVGSDWQWIDKPMSLRRPVALFDERPLTVEPDRDMLFVQGVSDRSAAVRRAALAGLIRHRLGTPLARKHALKLSSDRSPSVRDRAEFLLRHNAERTKS